MNVKLYVYKAGGTDRISKEKLKLACIRVDMKLSPSELDEMFAEADTDNNGYIDKIEFSRIMMETNLF